MHDVLPSSPVETAAFRRLMGQFATGVCVVSANAANGELAGITVNSLVSVSLDPLLISWSLQNTSSQFDVWSNSHDFAISILSEDQGDLARRYANRGNSGLKKSDFVLSETGLPVIDKALGHLECRQWSLYPAGDHTMIFGEVVGIYQAIKGKPLGFFGGEFCRIAD